MGLIHKTNGTNGHNQWAWDPHKEFLLEGRYKLHTAVHAPPRSRATTTVINDLDDWEMVVEEFELCGGVISESDRRAVLLKKLPPGVSSSLVSNLRRCNTYREMKAELKEDITFMKDWGLE